MRTVLISHISHFETTKKKKRRTFSNNFSPRHDARRPNRIIVIFHLSACDMPQDISNDQTEQLVVLLWDGSFGTVKIGGRAYLAA